jgi:hypothetical protein
MSKGTGIHVEICHTILKKLRAPCFCAVALIFALSSVSSARPQKDAHSRATGTVAAAEAGPPATGVHFVSVHGYPELQVDGRPFFIHAAEFSYYRIPRDLWSRSLDRYRELGINTIDLRIPWNWHEPHEGEFDFTGKSNPRRDLRGLLEMISLKGFHLIARPGPTIGDEWRNGGYPDWLLGRAEYQMPEVDRVAGLYAPAERAAAANAEEGAAQWLGNATHMHYAALWLAAVAHELAPYSSTKKMALPADAAREPNASDKASSGPLLFIFLDDAAAQETSGKTAPRYLQYVKTLRGALISGGVEGDFAVTATNAEEGVSSSLADSGIAVFGDWFLHPAAHLQSDDPKNRAVHLLDSDAQSLALLAQSLRMQSTFPALLGGFQAGWFTPADDSRPEISPAANTLLASRWLMAQGVGGIDYSPLQETLTPPGYQVANANREFRWDAALDLSGERQARAHAVERNARMLELWGEFLASSHPRTGIGVVNWKIGLSQSEGVSPGIIEAAAGKLSNTMQQVERLAFLAGLPVEEVNPADQAPDALLHDPALLLVIPDSLRGKTFLPAKAQTALLEYVRAGGVLLCNPERPAGSVFDEALRGISVEPAGGGLSTIRLGRGWLVLWSKDFYSWVNTDESFSASLARPEASWAIKELLNASRAANLQPDVIQPPDHAGALLLTELQTNENAGTPAANLPDCSLRPRCSTGLLSATNWSGDAPVQETVKVLLPGRDAATAEDSDYVQLPLQVSPGESLLLPLNYPLCAADASLADCPDRVMAAGAELLDASRDGKALVLTFYAPASATILLRLRSVPTKVDIPVLVPEKTHAPIEERGQGRGRHGNEDGGRFGPANMQDIIPRGFGNDFPERTLEGKYDKTTRIFEVVMPRGAAPDFLMKIEIHLNYVPDVPERKKPVKQHGRGYQYSVADAVRLPLGEGTSLATEPPLILLDKDRNGQLLLQADNLDDSTLTLQGTVNGPAQGTESLRMESEEETIETVKLRGSGSQDPDKAGLMQGSVVLTGGHTSERSSPVEFVVAEGDAPVHYEFDFERTGAKNWVLENNHLRLIFQPASGGQLIALLDKQTGLNLTTTVGGLRDLVRQPGASLVDAMFNVPYAAEWLTDKDGSRIRLTGQWPEGAPTSGEISKTIRISGKDTQDEIEVEYQFHARANADGAKPESKLADGALAVTAFSVPADGQAPEITQFCWFAAPRRQSPQTEKKEAGAQPAPVCKGYVAGAEAITLPAEAARLEVRTLGRPTLGMEWTEGRVVIEQKQFSARILLELPGAKAGEAGFSGHSVVRYTVLQAP